MRASTILLISGLFLILVGTFGCRSTSKEPTDFDRRWTAETDPYRTEVTTTYTRKLSGNRRATVDGGVVEEEGEMRVSGRALAPPMKLGTFGDLQTWDGDRPLD